MNATPQADFASRLPIILLVAILVVCGVAWFLKRRTQFRLSTILWIITLVAVVLGWMFDRHQYELRLIESKRLEAKIKVLEAELGAEQALAKHYQSLISTEAAETAVEQK